MSFDQPWEYWLMVSQRRGLTTPSMEPSWVYSMARKPRLIFAVRHAESFTLDASERWQLSSLEWS